MRILLSAEFWICRTRSLVSPTILPTWASVLPRRSRLALAAVRLLAATLWLANPLPRRDGPLSVRRSYTPEELEALLREAGLHGARVDRKGPVRMRAVGGGLDSVSSERAA